MQSSQPSTESSLAFLHRTGSAAVLVTFSPSGGFPSVLTAAASQVDHLLVWDNSVVADSQDAVARAVATERVRQSNLQHPVDLLLHQDGKNVGLSVAYNAGLRYARGMGVAWLLLLDQDTELPPGVVAWLLALAERYSQQLALGAVCALNDEKVEVSLSPRHALEKLSAGYERQQYRSHRLYRDAEVREIRSLTNSGALISVVAAMTVGGFDEHLFLDAVDYRLSIQLTRRGFHLLESSRAKVAHTQGEPYVVSFAGLRIRMRRYSTERSYHMVRDSLTFARLSFRDARLFVLSVLANVAFGTVGAVAVLPARGERLRKIVAGLSDSLRRRSTGRPVA